MRIAVLADVHGNLPAFEAALHHAKQHSPDVTILAGDIVNGAPDSRLCWELASSLEFPILRGNHERYVGFYGTPEAPAEWKDERFGPVRWAAAQLTEQQRVALRALPLSLQLPSCPDLLVCHSTLRSDGETLAAYTPEAHLADMFPDTSARLIVRGHNHAPAVRLWGDRRIITTGAVGLTLDGIPTAQYLLITQKASGWQIDHQSVEYDRERALRRFDETGYIKTAGPMARLFYREVATASFHIVPFMRICNQLIAQTGSLEAAVELFLSGRGA